MESEKKTPLMLRGSGGHKDYYLIAANSTVGLGFKILGMFPGFMDGMPGTVGYAIRVRSCRIEDEELDAIYGPDAKTGPSPDFETAWKGLKWEQSNSQRVSTILKAFHEPDFSLNGRELMVPEKIKDGTQRSEWATKLSEAVEGTKVLLNDEQIADLLLEYETNFLEAVRKEFVGKEIAKEVTAEAEEEYKASGLQIDTKELAVKIKKKFVQEFPDEAAKDPADGANADE